MAFLMNIQVTLGNSCFEATGKLARDQLLGKEGLR